MYRVVSVLLGAACLASAAAAAPITPPSAIQAHDAAPRAATLFAALKRNRAPGAPWPGPLAKAAVQQAISTLLSDPDPALSDARAALVQRDFAGAARMLRDLAKAGPSKAVIRYRQAGALAYYCDPVLAMDAYEQAAMLDPADAWTWIWLSELNGAQGHTARAAETARTALSTATAPDTRGAALEELGDALLGRGDRPAALKAYGQALTLRRSLAFATQNDAVRWRSYSLALTSLGDADLAGGDAPGARKVYSQALSITRILARISLARA